MTEIESTLKMKLLEDPTATVRAIIRTDGDPKARVGALQKKGFRIVHTSALINAITVEGTAQAVLGLQAEPWALKIEEDKVVHTM